MAVHEPYVVKLHPPTTLIGVELAARIVGTAEVSVVCASALACVICQYAPTWPGLKIALLAVSASPAPRVEEQVSVIAVDTGKDSVLNTAVPVIAVPEYRNRMFRATPNLRPRRIVVVPATSFNSNSSFHALEMNAWT